MKSWLGSDVIVTDVWEISFFRLGKKITVDIKFDDGGDFFSLPMGQYLLYRQYHPLTLYIFQSGPDNLDILYWWQTHENLPRSEGSDYKYFLLDRKKCKNGRLDKLREICLSA